MPDDKIPTNQLLEQLVREAGISGFTRPEPETMAVVNATLREIVESPPNAKPPGSEALFAFGWGDQYVSIRGVVKDAIVIFLSVFALVHTGGLSWIPLAPIAADALSKLHKNFALLTAGEVEIYKALLRASRMRMQAHPELRGDGRFVTIEEVRAALEPAQREQIGLGRHLEDFGRRNIAEQRVIDGVDRFTVRM